jgi:hypothetical protein
MSLINLLKNDPQFFYYGGEGFVQKSLKYGQDTPGGGDSGQPYIKTDINNVDRGFNQLRLTKFDDGLIRGGAVGALNASVVDTLRIGKFLKDFPKGPLFIAKQVGLQLSNPKIETKPIPSLFGATTTGIGGLINRGINLLNNNKIGPTRIYNLGLNTIAQIPVNAFGQHFNRHGFTPVQDENTKYFSVVKDKDAINTFGKNNRLVGLKEKLIGKPIASQSRNFGLLNTLISSIGSVFGFSNPLRTLTANQLNIDDYLGGPGSVYGIGRTIIRRYDTTGIKNLNKIPFSEEKNTSRKIDLSNYLNLKFENTETPSNYISSTTNLINNSKEIEKALSQNAVEYNTKSNSVKTYEKLKNNINFLSKEKHQIPGNGYGLNYFDNEFQPIDSIDDSSKIGLTRNDPQFLYNGGGIPNDSRDGITYDNNQYFDRIDSDILQIVFRIINPFNPNDIERIFLSAYMNGFKDNFSATWDETNYNGRSENFYIYNKGKRDVSFNLQIPCFNKKELFEKHRALGQLAATTAGTYSTSNNALGGVLIRLNVGRYLEGEYGILNSLSYDIPDNATWDVEQNSRLSMILNVSFNFTIIHQNLPQFNFTNNSTNGFFGYLPDKIPGYIIKGNRDELTQRIINYGFTGEEVPLTEDEKVKMRRTDSINVNSRGLNSISNPNPPNQPTINLPYYQEPRLLPTQPTKKQIRQINKAIKRSPQIDSIFPPSNLGTT